MVLLNPTGPTAELLRKAALHIKNEPKRFDMQYFQLTSKCGTIHCIGGWCDHILGENDNNGLSLERTFNQEFGFNNEVNWMSFFYPDMWWNSLMGSYIDFDVKEDKDKDEFHYLFKVMTENPKIVSEILLDIADGKTSLPCF